MAGRIRPLWRRFAPVSRVQPSTRSRLLEMVLWVVVGAFGVFFLIPAVSHLLEARVQEADEHEKTDSSRAQAEKSQQDLDWMHLPRTAVQNNNPFQNDC